jgi:MFS transporter, FHS family, glucose/mannose:H+ symporter
MYKKNLVFAAACIGMLLFGIVFLSLGTILTFITTKFGVDSGTAGALASSLPFGMLIGSVIFGPIVDRYGYKNLLIICAVIIMLALEGIAVAGTFAVLQLSFFLIGFGGGIINGGTNALVADISEDMKGANLSLLGVFFGIGALGMPIVLGLLTKYFAYTSIIAGIGGAIVLPIAFFAAISFPEAKQAQGMPIKNSLALLKEGTLWLFGIVLFFESGLEGIVGNWTTTFLQGMNISTADALYGLSIQVAALTVTRLVLGGVLKKIPSHLVLLAGYAIICAGAVTLMMAGSLPIAMAGLALLGVGFAAGFPVVLGFVGAQYAKMSGTAFSMVLVLALTGNTLINYMVGVVSQSSGIGTFPLVLIACTAGMTVFFLLARRSMNASMKQQIH